MTGTPRAGTLAMDVLRHAVDSATVRTVFGDPITEAGVTVIPVARVHIAGGGGGGTSPGTDGADGGGDGSGFARSCRPAGVFVLSDGKVTWRPALDVNKIIIGGQVIATVALLAVRAIIRSRRS